MKKRLVLWLIPCLMMCHSFTFAQIYNTNIQLDTNNILIGDFINVQLSVTTSSPAPIMISPITAEFLSDKGIELIRPGQLLKEELNGVITYSQTIIVTSYDEGDYYFPTLVIFGSDSMPVALTDSLFFRVNTIPVDTTAAFRDIKGNINVPLTLKEILPVIFTILLGLIFVIIIVWILFKFVLKKRPKIIPIREKPKEKPDIIALKALEELRLKGLWQTGKVKLYYSELTEIIRIYIEDRYDINAMEMVSDEILHELSLHQLHEEALPKLSNLLQMADLVKFAKWTPLPDDFDRCFKNAVNFVELTKEQEII